MPRPASPKPMSRRAIKSALSLSLLRALYSQVQSRRAEMSAGTVPLVITGRLLRLLDRQRVQRIESLRARAAMSKEELRALPSNKDVRLQNGNVVAFESKIPPAEAAAVLDACAYVTFVIVTANRECATADEEAALRETRIAFRLQEQQRVFARQQQPFQIMDDDNSDGGFGGSDDDAVASGARRKKTGKKGARNAASGGDAEDDDEADGDNGPESVRFLRLEVFPRLFTLGIYNCGDVEAISGIDSVAKVLIRQSELPRQVLISRAASTIRAPPLIFCFSTLRHVDFDVDLGLPSEMLEQLSSFCYSLRSVKITIVELPLESLLQLNAAKRKRLAAARAGVPDAAQQSAAVLWQQAPGGSAAAAAAVSTAFLQRFNPVVANRRLFADLWRPQGPLVKLALGGAAAVDGGLDKAAAAHWSALTSVSLVGNLSTLARLGIDASGGRSSVGIVALDDSWRGLRNVTQLGLSGLRLQNFADLAPLRDLHQLRDLDLSKNVLSSFEDFDSVFHAAPLERLNLEGNMLVAEELDELVGGMPSVPALATMDDLRDAMSEEYDGPSPSAAPSDVASFAGTASVAGRGGRRWTDDDGSGALRRSRLCSTLAHLDLSGNRLGQWHCLRALCRLVRLATLDLRANPLDLRDARGLNAARPDDTVSSLLFVLTSADHTTYISTVKAEAVTALARASAAARSSAVILAPSAPSFAGGNPELASLQQRYLKRLQATPMSDGSRLAVVNGMSVTRDLRSAARSDTLRRTAEAMLSQEIVAAARVRDQQDRQQQAMQSTAPSTFLGAPGALDRAVTSTTPFSIKRASQAALPGSAATTAIIKSTAVAQSSARLQQLLGAPGAGGPEDDASSVAPSTVATTVKKKRVVVTRTKDGQVVKRVTLPGDAPAASAPVLHHHEDDIARPSKSPRPLQGPSEFSSGARSSAAFVLPSASPRGSAAVGGAHVDPVAAPSPRASTTVLSPLAEEAALSHQGPSSPTTVPTNGSGMPPLAPSPSGAAKPPVKKIVKKVVKKAGGANAAGASATTDDVTVAGVASLPSPNDPMHARTVVITRETSVSNPSESAPMNFPATLKVSELAETVGVKGDLPIDILRETHGDAYLLHLPAPPVEVDDGATTAAAEAAAAAARAAAEEAAKKRFYVSLVRRSRLYPVPAAFNSFLEDLTHHEWHAAPWTVSPNLLAQNQKQPTFPLPIGAKMFPTSAAVICSDFSFENASFWELPFRVTSSADVAAAVVAAATSGLPPPAASAAVGVAPFCVHPEAAEVMIVSREQAQQPPTALNGATRYFQKVLFRVVEVRSGYSRHIRIEERDLSMLEPSFFHAAQRELSSAAVEMNAVRPVEIRRADAERLAEIERAKKAAAKAEAAAAEASAAPASAGADAAAAGGDASGQNTFFLAAGSGAEQTVVTAQKDVRRLEVERAAALAEEENRRAMKYQFAPLTTPPPALSPAWGRVMVLEGEELPSFCGQPPAVCVVLPHHDHTPARLMTTNIAVYKEPPVGTVGADVANFENVKDLSMEEIDMIHRNRVYTAETTEPMVLAGFVVPAQMAAEFRRQLVQQVKAAASRLSLLGVFREWPGTQARVGGAVYGSIGVATATPVEHSSPTDLPMTLAPARGKVVAAAHLEYRNIPLEPTGKHLREGIDAVSVVDPTGQRAFQPRYKSAKHSNPGIEHPTRQRLGLDVGIHDDELALALRSMVFVGKNVESITEFDFLGYFTQVSSRLPTWDASYESSCIVAGTTTRFCIAEDRNCVATLAEHRAALPSDGPAPSSTFVGGGAMMGALSSRHVADPSAGAASGLPPFTAAHGTSDETRCFPGTGRPTVYKYSELRAIMVSFDFSAIRLVFHDGRVPRVVQLLSRDRTHTMCFFAHLRRCGVLPQDVARTDDPVVEPVSKMAAFMKRQGLDGAAPDGVDAAALLPPKIFVRPCPIAKMIASPFVFSVHVLYRARLPLKGAVNGFQSIAAYPAMALGGPRDQIRVAHAAVPIEPEKIGASAWAAARLIITTKHVRLVPVADRLTGERKAAVDALSPSAKPAPSSIDGFVNIEAPTAPRDQGPAEVTPIESEDTPNLRAVLLAPQGVFPLVFGLRFDRRADWLCCAGHPNTLDALLRELRSLQRGIAISDLDRDVLRAITEGADWARNAATSGLAPPSTSIFEPMPPERKPVAKKEKA